MKHRFQQERGSLSLQGAGNTLQVSVNRRQMCKGATVGRTIPFPSCICRPPHTGIPPTSSCFRQANYHPRPLGVQPHFNGCRGTLPTVHVVSDRSAEGRSSKRSPQLCCAQASAVAGECIDWIIMIRQPCFTGSRNWEPKLHLLKPGPLDRQGKAGWRVIRILLSKSKASGRCWEARSKHNAKSMSIHC